jgi:hypothetical protein
MSEPIKKKRILTEEQKERLKAQLAKGRETAKANREAKKKEVKPKKEKPKEVKPESEPVKPLPEVSEPVKPEPEKPLTKTQKNKLEKQKLADDKKAIKAKIKAEKLAEKEKIKEQKKALREKLKNDKVDRARKEREIAKHKKHLAKQENLKLEIQKEAEIEVNQELHDEMLKEIEMELDNYSPELSDVSEEETENTNNPTDDRIQENMKIFNVPVSEPIHIEPKKIKKMMKNRYGQLVEVLI